MSVLFSKPSMPFYRFGDLLFLQKIETNHWVKYIQSRFLHTHKAVSDDFAERICRTVDNHSSYVQQFAWLVWIRTEKEVDEMIFEDALNDLINQNSMLYYSYMENLTALQMNFLFAIADGIHHEFSKKEVLSKYHLGNSANISRVRKSLEEKELIDISPRKVTINDPVFQLWLKKKRH
jgi:hypothetical protein